PQNPNHLYALFTIGFYNDLNQLRDYNVILKQSLDAGATWSEIALPYNWANIPWHALSMAIDPLNENKILIGALNVYALNNTASPTILPNDWIMLSYWGAKYYFDDPNLLQEDRDYFRQIYVHGDIHDIQYFNLDSDNILITTDGGVFQSSDISLTGSYNPETPRVGIPSFFPLNNALNTTQYYYATINPTKGSYNFIGGTQDNGSIMTINNNGAIEESMISGGDGGFCFWDRDDPSLKITSVYGNRYYIHANGNVYFTPEIDGLFVNPGVYDDEANLIYSNAASSSNGGLYANLLGRYYDSLRVVNVNKFIGKPDLGLDTSSYIPLNTGIQEAITALKLSPHSSPENRTLFIGTEYGKVFKIEGLPYNPSSTRIDNNQINQGYISSIDVGKDNSKILVTISNYGLSSVYNTRNGGDDWTNLELNLPDIPVRWGLYNPFDDAKIMLATELGVWGLEDLLNPTERWQSYNLGLPQIRIDMIDIRKEDSTILAATHGQGLYYGKFDQGNPVILGNEISSPKELFYPNPFNSTIYLHNNQVKMVMIYDTNGRLVYKEKLLDNSVNLTSLNSGIYIIHGIDEKEKVLITQKLIKY
ncbi:MAG: T9SS type A sorting domain-containing protein, partial [Cyclobacteriaceae bacterium]|nr:T9SS type A sorting domain-containing protein [Cyclobacteriaceae bacterium]